MQDSMPPSDRSGAENPEPLQKLCFVIGPMNDDHMPKLRALAADIIAPILPPGYVVKTPDQGGAGNVMDQVMAACDSATLVIADMTGNNPNVLYEVGVLDSLGRLCIPVKPKPEVQKDEDRILAGKDPMTFDRAAYRFWVIDWDQPEATRTELKKAIDISLNDLRTGILIGNPVTNYYGAPVIDISPASGIALGYYENFVKNSVRNFATLFGTEYRPVLFGDSKVEKEMTPLPDDLRETLELQIVIPDRLNYADHTYIAQDLVQKRLLKPAVIKSDFSVEARSMTLYMWSDPDPKAWALVDIPTAMNVMRKSIKRRLGRRDKVNDTSPEWRQLERQEIARFREELDLNIKDSEQPSYVRDRARLVGWNETPLKKARRV
jgi:hypothetical protein